MRMIPRCPFIGQFDVSGITQQGQQAKKCAENVFAFRNPGNRFHVQRMNGKDYGHGGAAPDGPGHSQEQEEEQNGVGRVQKNVGQVRPARAGAKKGRVQHERQPGHRVPVGIFTAGKGPLGVRKRQTAQDMGIGEEIA